MEYFDISLLQEFSHSIYFLFVVYPILGAGIKYIDSAYDNQVFSKKKALVVAPILGLLWAYSMIIDPFSATVLLAVLVGVTLKLKIDNYAHLIGMVIILVFIVFFRVQLLWLPLVFLSAAAVLDELGNDIIDYNQKLVCIKKFRDQFALYFFGRRYLLKAALLYLFVLGVIPIFYLLALIFFDEAYIIMGLYNLSKKKK